MPELFQLIISNLLYPPILFFLLGIFAGLVKSDLEIPESISKYLSIYLMIAIGFKGGAGLHTQTDLGSFFPLLIAAITLGFIQPFISYAILGINTNLDSSTKAAVAAQYGSVSIVTFVIASAFLRFKGIEAEAYIVAILAIMEIPAIFSGLLIAMNRDKNYQGQKWRTILAKIGSSGAIILLLGSFIIGFIGGESGYTKMEGFVVIPFQGFLALFLLDMGISVMRNVHSLGKVTKKLWLFGIYMPLISSVLGLAICLLLKLDVGTATLFITLAASASYIAVPAVVKLTLPQANPAVYLPLALGVTFPFNAIIGIPLYLEAVLYFS